MIPIPCVYDMLTLMIQGVLSRQEVIHGLKPAQALCSLRNYFTFFVELEKKTCFVFLLCVGLSNIFTPLHVGLADSGRYTFEEHREKHLRHRLTNSAVDSGLSGSKATFWSLLC